ncbi:MAG: BON domain-containing protein [Burkholderiales bacterium]|nr:BON domain-containing protein [Burkholderiales bacterium]
MRFIRILALLLVAGFGAVQIQGCAATDTRRSTTETVDDGVVTARVKTALLQDKDVSGLAVNVDTYRGVVQLSGFVDNQNQVDKAASIAEQVPGVVSVKNGLRVKPQS